MTTASIFVVADTEGHALAVIATQHEAREWAAQDARRYAEGRPLRWTIEYTDAAPTWTALTAWDAQPAAGAPIAGYVVTELPENGVAVDTTQRPPSTATIVRTELAEVDPAEPATPVAAPAAAPAAGPADAAVEVEAAAPAEEVATVGPDALPPCEGRYEGCTGTVETAEQLHLSNFKQQIPLCRNCLKHEVANNIDPRPGS